METFLVVAHRSKHSMNVCLTPLSRRCQARACAAIVFGCSNESHHHGGNGRTIQVIISVDEGEAG